MGKLAFAVVNALPARVFAALATASTIYATIWPKDAGRMITELDPDTVRIWAVVGLAITVIYWAVWFRLRPKEAEAPPTGSLKPSFDSSRRIDTGGGEFSGVATLGDNSPITQNYDRQAFVLTDEEIQKILGEIDTRQALIIASSTDARSKEIADEISAALAAYGVSASHAMQGVRGLESQGSVWRVAQPGDTLKPGARINAQMLVVRAV